MPHIFQLDKAKIMDLPLLCFQHEKEKGFKNCWFYCHSGGMHCVQQKLETQPTPTQMLRPHATSRQWPMQIAWQGQWKLMEDSLVILH